MNKEYFVSALLRSDRDAFAHKKFIKAKPSVKSVISQFLSDANMSTQGDSIASIIDMDMCFSGIGTSSKKHHAVGYYIEIENHTVEPSYINWMVLNGFSIINPPRYADYINQKECEK